ncbi:MAG: KaiB domain protein [Akkermansiaceae bacterium]|nr:KaiB domain protein [Akkermansiaceae bacterium]
MTEPPQPELTPSEQTRAEFERLLSAEPEIQHYVLVLFVTGNTLRSSQAVANVRSLCERHLAGRYELEVVDIYQNPARLAENQIVAAPTLLKMEPVPPLRLVGNLADPERVLLGLNLKHRPEINWIPV